MFFALIKKEFFQIIRDFSSILIAFILPLIILVLYRWSVNLDTVKITLGIKNEDRSPKISTLINSFHHSDYIKTQYINSYDEIDYKIKNSILKGAIIFPNDFTTKLSKKEPVDILVITDGAEANLANFVQSYCLSIVNNWFYNVSDFKYDLKPPLIQINSRFWYNQDINSHHFILPGSLAITMNLIGMLLTALVISREWERGTIEALFATKIRKIDFVLGKYIPYFILECYLLCLIFSFVLWFLEYLLGAIY